MMRRGREGWGANQALYNALKNLFDDQEKVRKKAERKKARRKPPGYYKPGAPVKEAKHVKCVWIAGDFRAGEFRTRREALAVMPDGKRDSGLPLQPIRVPVPTR